MNCDVMMVGGGHHGSAGVSGTRDWYDPGTPNEPGDDCEPHEVRWAGGGGGGGQGWQSSWNLVGSVAVTVGGVGQPSSVGGITTVQPGVQALPAVNMQHSGGYGTSGSGQGGGGYAWSGGGGGGGHGAPGGNGNSTYNSGCGLGDNTGKGGAGGNGFVSDYSGTGQWFGSGGGGGGAQAGGAAGAWAGAGGADGNPGANAGFYGCGGGGAGAGNGTIGYGMQGLVIIRYPGAQVCTGGTVTSAAGYTVHTFYSSGTFTVPAAPTITSIERTSYARGTVNLYSHVWGTNLIANTYGVFSGTGCSAPFAAWSGDGALIALYFNIAADAALGARTFYVTNAYGNSNAVTVYIVDPPPTLTSITGIGGGPAQGFIGTKCRVLLNGTNFIGNVTVSAPGITITNVSVQSSTQIAAEFTGTGLGDQPVTVTASGGSTATKPFTVLAVTSLPSSGLIVNQVLGTLHNTHIGPLGVVFTVGAKDRLVTHLGRWKHSGNALKHTIMLRNSGYEELGRVIIDMAVGTQDTWNYVALPTPIQLKAGQYYFLSDIDATYQNDMWANISNVAGDGNATINGTLSEASTMYSFVRGTSRTDPISLGFRFTANGSYGISALGRWKQPGNNKAHRVVLKDSSNTIIRSCVVDFTGGKGIDNAFNYTPIPYMVLTAGAYYYVLSDEGEGDAWFDYPCTITPWGGHSITGYAYEAFPATSGVIPNYGGGPANTMYVGVDVLSIIGGWSGASEAYITVNLKWIESGGQPMAMII